MRPVVVVVVDVDTEHLLKLSPTDAQDPEAIASDSADPALGEYVRLRCANRRSEDLDAFASEHVIEDGAELAVSIVDQKLDWC
jgi:hypothetical protein